MAKERQSLLKVNEELNRDGMLCPLGWAQNSIQFMFVCLFDLGFRPKGPEYMLTKMVAQYSQKPWQSLSKVNEELNCDGMLCPLGWAQKFKKVMTLQKCLFV